LHREGIDGVVLDIRHKPILLKTGCSHSIFHRVHTLGHHPNLLLLKVTGKENMPATVLSQSEGVPLITLPKKGPRGEVILYATWCKGCHICVELCPTKVLAMDEDEDYPRIVLPEKCTACHFCDTHCPDLAIVVRRLD
jgi:2-oxoglutarate ferredoxin oxidoreductase subunit delta